MFDMFSIVQQNWTLFLIGQYPHGPLGGLASTLILAALALLLAFPFGLLLALARVSPWKGLYWVATVWVYVLRGIPLLMVIFWTYFLVPLLIGGVAFATAVIFAALPTASSAYILAMRMGGDGPGVAWLISATTVAAALTLTGWLAALTRWGPA